MVINNLEVDVYDFYNFTDDEDLKIPYVKYVDEEKKIKSSEDNEDYVTSIMVRYKDYLFTADVYSDDYGQCYYVKYISNDGKVREMGCGTYNFDYIEVVICIARAFKEKENKGNKEK